MSSKPAAGKAGEPTSPSLAKPGATPRGGTPARGATPSKAERREEARLKAQQLREEEQRRMRRQRGVLMAIVAVALVAVIGIAAFILSNRPEPAPDFSGVEDPLSEVVAPTGGTDTGAIRLGPDGVVDAAAEVPEDAVVVQVYADFLCPFCRAFEESNGPVLDALREDGTIVLEYHPIAILDHASRGSQYSTRTSTAAALVADRAPEAFSDFVEVLYANQPAEGTSGLSDEQIADLAAGVGVGDDVVGAIRDGSYTEGDDSFSPWVAASTEQASRDLPRLATPTILIDGEELSELGVDWREEGALEAAVEAAR